MDFVTGRYFDAELAKEYRYLDKYFDTDTERQFIRHYLLFRNIDFFTNHTGVFCTRRWLLEMAVRFKRLEEARKKARDDMDFDTLGIIEAGNFKWKGVQ
jgi:hypothetical protein